MLGKRLMAEKNLLLFNLKTDADDDVLGFTSDWINALAVHFERVFVITMYAGRIEVAENVEVYSVGREKGYSKQRRVFEFYRMLWMLLRNEKIDACFAHMIQIFAVLGWPLLHLKGIPIVLWYAHKTVNPTVRLAEKLVDRIVASSKSGFQLDTPKLRIIGQGIDTERFSPPVKGASDTRPFTILCLGRVSPIKRIEVLIEALGMLRKSNLGCRLKVNIVGGPLSDDDRLYVGQLKKLAVTLQVDDMVTFAGSRSFREVHSFYQDADCYVNSSDTDSVDKTVLEAMSCGIPVITSNIAFHQVLSPVLASRWLIAKNDVSALHEALVRLVHMSEAERTALGHSLREIVVNDHSLPSLAGKIAMEIEQLLEKTSSLTTNVQR
jgi:glycosyltransferase involved in cell wall biosynthesis